MQEIKRLQRAGGMVVFGKGSANHSLLLSELFSFLTLLNPSRPAAHGSPMAGARSAGASLSREPVTGQVGELVRPNKILAHRSQVTSAGDTGSVTPCNASNSTPEDKF